NRDCAVIRFAVGVTARTMIIVGQTASADNFVLQDLTLDGNGANWGSCASGAHEGIRRGAFAGTADHARISNVVIKNFYHTGCSASVAVNWGNQGWTDFVIRDSVFLGNFGKVVNVKCTSGTCSHFTATNLYFDDLTAFDPAIAAASNADYNLQVSLPGGDASITNVQCVGNCYGSCVKCFVEGCRITESYANGCYRDQFIVTQSAWQSSRSCILSHNIALNGQDGGLGLETSAGIDGPTSCTVTANTTKGNGSAGLFLVNPVDDVVEANVFEANGTRGSACTCTGATQVTDCGTGGFCDASLLCS